jgi:hypothetical protein
MGLNAQTASPTTVGEHPRRQQAGHAATDDDGVRPVGARAVILYGTSGVVCPAHKVTSLMRTLL